MVLLPLESVLVISRVLCPWSKETVGGAGGRGDGWSHCVSLTSVLELVVSKVSKELQLPDY